MPPRRRSAGVCKAAGVDGLDELPPPQRMMLLGLVRLYFGQANDLLDRLVGQQAGPSPTDCSTGWAAAR